MNLLHGQNKSCGFERNLVMELVNIYILEMVYECVNDDKQTTLQSTSLKRDRLA